MNIKIKISVRRVAKGKLKKARFYADFRVSQSPTIISYGKENFYEPSNGSFVKQKKHKSI